MKQVLTVSTVAAMLALSLTGCGPKSTSHSSSSGSKGGSCSSNFTSAKINGQTKCLQQGQQCQQAQSSSYKKYGFSCTKTNGRYQLSKK